MERKKLLIMALTNANSFLFGLLNQLTRLSTLRERKQTHVGACVVQIANRLSSNERAYVFVCMCAHVDQLRRTNIRSVSVVIRL